MGRYGSVLQPQPLAHGCGCAPLLTPTPVTRRHLPSTISTPALLLVHACQKAPPKSNQLQWATISGSNHHCHSGPLPQATNCKWATVSGPICWWTSGPQAESEVRGRSWLSPLGPPARPGDGGRWKVEEGVVTARPRDPLWLSGLGRDPGARGGRGHSPRPLPHLPGPKPPGKQKNGFSYQRTETLPNRRHYPRLPLAATSFFFLSRCRPPSSQQQHQQKSKTARVKDGARLQAQL